jgi:hypothetical protein
VTLQTGVEIFAVIHLTTMGLSHMVAHRAWAEFFILLRDEGRPGVFVVGFLSLGFGSVIAAFHPVWSGVPLVLTMLGWAQVLKGLLYLCIPSYGLKKLGLVSIDRSRMFIVPGVAFLLLAALILWSLLG